MKSSFGKALLTSDSSWNTTCMLSDCRSHSGGAGFELERRFNTGVGGKSVARRSVVLRFFRSMSQSSAIISLATLAAGWLTIRFRFRWTEISAARVLPSLSAIEGSSASTIILSDWLIFGNWTDRSVWSACCCCCCNKILSSSGDSVDITKFASNVSKFFITKTTGLKWKTIHRIHTIENACSIALTLLPIWI